MTLRAPAGKEGQRRKQAVARLNRVRSAVTPMVTVPEGTKVSVHQVQPADASGQLRFLGLLNILSRVRRKNTPRRAFSYSWAPRRTPRSCLRGCARRVQSGCHQDR